MVGTQSDGAPGPGWYAWSVDLDAAVARFDDRFAQRFGLEPLGPLRAVADRLHPDDRERLLHGVGSAREGRLPPIMAYRLQDGAGQWRWVSAISHLGLEGGRVHSLYGLVAEIDHDARGASLHKLERHHRVLAEVNRAMVSAETIEVLMQRVCDTFVEHGGILTAMAQRIEDPAQAPQTRARAGHRLAAIEALCQQTTGAMWLGLAGGEVWVSNDVAHDARLQHAAQVMAGDGCLALALIPVQTRSGPWGFFELHGAAAGIFDDDALSFLRQLGDDLSFAVQKLVAEGELHDRAELHQRVFEAAPDAIFVADAQNRYVEANPAAERLVGYTLAELRERTIFDLSVPEDQPRLHLLRQDRPVLRERILRHKDGSHVTVEISAMRLSNGGSQSICRDLTERRKMEARLMLADRMGSLGTLASGVAHELNNPLSWMISNLSQARELTHGLGGHAHQTELLELLDDTLEGAHRIVSIVSDLKTFSRTDAGAVKLSVHRVVDRAVQLLSLQARYRGRLLRKLDPVPEVRANEAQLTQVLVNLLLNAVQALPEGRPDLHEVEVSTHRVDDGRVCIAVRDTGVGISPETLRHLFDPFFTTKPVGVGTGLGLSVAFNIISSLGGTIEVESQPGQGATFRVLLPAFEADEALVNPTGAEG
jgi:PAS domain S-box-containing protein